MIACLSCSHQGPLPSSYLEFKRRLAVVFPLIFDTKFVAESDHFQGQLDSTPHFRYVFVAAKLRPLSVVATSQKQQQNGQDNKGQSSNGPVKMGEKSQDYKELGLTCP